MTLISNLVDTPVYTATTAPTAKYRGSAEIVIQELVDLAAGTWLAVTGTSIDDAGIDPDPAVSTGSPLTTDQWNILKGTNSNGGVFNYSGGVYCEDTYKYYIHGGGHTNYHGNEWYAFNLQTMQWEFVDWPDARTSIPSTATAYGETTSVPSAYHTYFGLAYSSTSGTLLRGGSSPSGTSTSITTGKPWTYDLSTGAWTELTDLSEVDASSNRNGPINNSVYDSTNDRFWQHTKYALWSRDAASPDTPTLQYVGDGSDGWWIGDQVVGQGIYSPMGHDPVNNLIVVWNTASTGDLIYDISDPDNVGRPTKNPSWTGDGTAILSSVTQPAYDPVNGDFLSWNGGANVYAIDANALTATTITPDGANAVTPTSAHPEGTYGRWRYCGTYGGKSCFMVINGADQAVYFYKRA